MTMPPASTITPFENTDREGELGTSGYRISTAYQFSGSRTHIECTLPNGQTQRITGVAID